MCLPGAERVILSASEGPQQCPSFPCGLKFFSPPSILLFLAPAGYTFLESALELTSHAHAKTPSRRRGLNCANNVELHVERGTATAGALHIRVFELEARAFQRLDVIDACALQIHERGRIDENLESIVFEGLIHGSSAVFELHAVGESRAAAAHNAHAQTRGNRSLLRHDLLNFGDRSCSEGERSGLDSRSCSGRRHGLLF